MFIQKLKTITLVLVISFVAIFIAFPNIPAARATTCIPGVNCPLSSQNLYGESTVTINPANIANFVVTGDYNLFVRLGILYAGVDFYSADGGRSFSEGAISNWNLNNWAIIDPYGTFDGNGTFYYGYVLDTTTKLGMALAKGVSGGPALTMLPFSWTASDSYRLSNGTYVHPCVASNQLIGPDFPKIAVDIGLASPHQGRLYWFTELSVALGGTYGSCTAGLIGFESSSDGGQTWTNKQVFDNSYLSAYDGEDSMAIGYDGTIFVTGANGVNCANGIGIAKSTDGGNSFAQTCIYNPSSGSSATPIPCCGITGRGGGANIAASIMDGLVTVVFAGCPFQSASQCTKSDGLTLTNSHLYSISSSDGGLTWSSIKRIDDVVAPNDNNQAVGRRYSVFISNEDTTEAAWFDSRNSNGNNTSADVYVSWIRAYPGSPSSSWATNVRVTNAPGFICNDPSTKQCQEPGNDYLGITGLANVYGSSIGNYIYVAYLTNCLVGGQCTQYYSQPVVLSGPQVVPHMEGLMGWAEGPHNYSNLTMIVYGYLYYTSGANQNINGKLLLVVSNTTTAVLLYNKVYTIFQYTSSGATSFILGSIMRPLPFNVSAEISINATSTSPITLFQRSRSLDVNNDGKVDVSDVIEVYTHEFTTNLPSRDDVTANPPDQTDNSVDITDLTLVYVWEFKTYYS